MSASLRACWSEMYVVIRVVRGSWTGEGHRTPDGGRYTSGGSARVGEARLAARAEAPAARRGGQPVGAAVADRAAQPHDVAPVRAQRLARADREPAAVRLDAHLGLDPVPSARAQDRGPRAHVQHPLRE